MDDKRLKVLFISSWYPSRVNALLGIFVKRHAAALTPYADVSSVYVCSDLTEGVEESVEENVYTVRIYYKKVTSHIPLYSDCLRLARYVGAWKKALRIYKAKKARPDIISSNVVFPVSLVARYLGKKWRAPYIITEHWTGYLPEDGRYRGFIVPFISKLAVKKASAVVAVSQNLKSRMLEMGLKNEYHIIPNIVDEKVFNILPSKKNNEKFNFIHISLLDDEQKNVSGIIKTFAKVHSKHPDTSLTIVGSGPSMDDLKHLAHSLNLDSSVEFTGTKIKEDLVKLINNSDAFVLFSNYENGPCVILESMCCGLPVISTRVGNVVEYINPSNGILVDIKDETQLAKAMEEIIAKKGQYMPDDIRATVVNKVTAEAVARQFMELYNKVLHK